MTKASDELSAARPARAAASRRCRHRPGSRCRTGLPRASSNRSRDRPRSDNGCSASARLRVTASFEFGLMTERGRSSVGHRSSSLRILVTAALLAGKRAGQSKHIPGACHCPNPSLRPRHPRRHRRAPPATCLSPMSGSPAKPSRRSAASLAPASARSTRAASWCCPGGIDGHAHIEQVSAAGIMNADTFESATALGGVRRHHHRDLVRRPARRHGCSGRWSTDYTALAKRGAVIDYAFHMIIADPTERRSHEDIPALVGEGFPRSRSS